MAPASTWMDKLRSTLAASPKPSTHITVLAFEAASLMSKLLHLWRSLSNPHLLHLCRQRLAIPAIRKLVSDDPSSLLSLAHAEFLDSLRLAAASFHPLSLRCSDPSLRHFRPLFDEFASLGRDPHGWSMTTKEMDSKAKKMEKYVIATAALYKEMDELAEREQYLRKLLHYSPAGGGKITATVTNLQQKIYWQKQEVRRLKDTSIWRRSFDSITCLLARAAFTVLARIKQAFHVPGACEGPVRPSSAVHPLAEEKGGGFWEANSAVLLPPAGTLGAEALALRYANMIAVIEKMVGSPRLIGEDARDELYGLLPGSVRGRLKARLRGVAGCAATDARLAAEWRAALRSIVEWLAPAARNTLRWQAERSFERRGGGAEKPGVMVVETLEFAAREKAEEAVVELLVGLNYVWRFEVEMGAKATAEAAFRQALAEGGNGASPISVRYIAPSSPSISKQMVRSPPLHCPWARNGQVGSPVHHR